MAGSPGFSFRSRIFFWAASIAGAAIIRALSFSWKMEVFLEDEAGDLGFGYDDPAVYVTWHRRMFGFFDFFGKRHVGVMISLSWDGEIVARAAAHLGFAPLRGSSTRGAVGGLHGVIKRLKAGKPAGFLADGPKGPPRIAKPGAVHASAGTGAPLVPVAFAAREAWVLNSWDRYIVPKPFTRICMVIGRPLRMRGRMGPEEAAEQQKRLGNEIDRVCGIAEGILRGNRCVRGLRRFPPRS